MKIEDIIKRFELQVDDSSELSTDESLDLANEVYVDICNDRPWEWLKSTATANTSITVPYIELEEDFKEMAQNKNNEIVVFVGTTYDEYKVVPFASRREYRDMSGYCYIDIPNQRLYFTKQPTEVQSVEYDYIIRPEVLVVGDEPLITTSQFGNLIAYGMAAKFNPIEQTEKDKSYQKENQQEYYKILSDLRLEDVNNKLM